MSSAKHISEEALRQVANKVLEHAPAGSISSAIQSSLQLPTLDALQDAAQALLLSGHLELAEAVFRTLKEEPGFDDRAAVGLAQIASKRGDAAAAAEAWRDCLGSFPQHLEPYWFAELARAERQLDRNVEAEATLRTCIQRFPKFAPAAVQLAELLSIRGEYEQATLLCERAIRDSPDEAQPWWFIALADALEATENKTQLERVLQDIVHRFPEAEATLVLLARNAARYEHWERALALWTMCLERYADSIRPEWLNGRAMALFRLLRAQEALDEWQHLIIRFPDFIHAYGDMSAAAEALGLWTQVYQVLAELVVRFPDHVRPEWLARRARCLMHPRPDPVIHRAIAELEGRFPDSSLGRKIAIEFAQCMGDGLKTVAPLVEDAVRRFPNDRQLSAEHVRVLLASGHFAEAEAIVQKLEAAEADHLELISRWRITIDKCGQEAIRDSAGQAALDGSWAIAPGLAIGEFLLNIWSAWATDLALVLYNNLAERFPGRLEIICAKARTLVVLRQDQQALELIDSVPATCQRREMLELRAWASAHRGDNQSARRFWQTILTHDYFPAVHADEPTLELLTPDRLGAHSERVTVFVMVRDELTNLPAFLRHYRKLGVHRFVAVDNLSTDGSKDYLRAQADVLLYWTADDFTMANSGMRWINTMIERHSTRWCLHVDADELFIYPGWESTPLSKLIEYLDSEGAEAMAAFMLDVYPERLLDASGTPTTHADAQYYDGDYVWVGHVRCPYQRPVGGIRSRLFHAQEYLHKIPLVNSRRGIYVTSHDTTPLRLSRLTGALLHYKLMGLANSHSPVAATGRSVEVMRRYERYATGLGAVSHEDLRRPGLTQALTDSFTLAERGLMQAPSEFRAWLERSELRGPASTDGQATS